MKLRAILIALFAALILLPPAARAEQVTLTCTVAGFNKTYTEIFDITAKAMANGHNYLIDKIENGSSGMIVYGHVGPLRVSKDPDLPNPSWVAYLQSPRH